MYTCGTVEMQIFEKVSVSGKRVTQVGGEHFHIRYRYQVSVIRPTFYAALTLNDFFFPNPHLMNSFIPFCKGLRTRCNRFLPTLRIFHEKWNFMGCLTTTFADSGMSMKCS